MFCVGTNKMEGLCFGWPEESGRFFIKGSVTATPHNVISSADGWRFRDGVNLNNCCHIDAKIFGKHLLDVESPDGTVVKAQQLLFELVDNDITQNYNGKFHRVGLYNGWKVCDVDNRDVLEIILVDGHIQIHGEFWDNGRLVMKSNQLSGVEASCPMMMS